VSAIAGVVQFDDAPIEPGLIERMTAAMASRGPDGISHWNNGFAAMGHCALRATPESLIEVQPLTNDDGTMVLVMDGRVDNGEEVRRDLLSRGVVLRDSSDAELVLRAYEVWGEESAGRIIGELAFLVWDAQHRTVYAAREPAGTRHFYYYVADRWFAFASEIRGLLALARIDRRLNESRLLDYLVEEFDRDDEVGTFYEGIKRLPAGHAMRITARGAHTWRYWNPNGLTELRFASLDECAEAFAEQLRIAIKCRLRATGCIGAQLSGGLDSSSIVGVIGKDFRHELAQPLKTFSLIREDRGTCPEWHSVRRLIDDGGIDASVITPRVGTEIWRSYVDGLAELNEPAAFTAGYTDFLLCRAARSAGCRVVLDGTAGDLLFYSFQRSLLRSASPAQIRAVFQAARRHEAGRMLPSLMWRGVWAATPEPVRAVGRKIRPLFWRPGVNARLLRRDVARRLVETRLAQRRQRGGPSTRPNDRTEHARDFTSGLLSYAHEINGPVALSAGLEPRSPFSDRRIIEFAVRMPVAAKLSAGWYKLLLRKSMAGTLPAAVQWRRDVGMHPGGEFRRQLIAEVSAGAPEIWNRAHVESTLAPWVDSQKLGHAWCTHERTGDLETGLNLLSLVVSAHWMSARFDRFHFR
jgi:asparagine synthase (glutamine-hydrolysing)